MNKPTRLKKLAAAHQLKRVPFFPVLGRPKKAIEYTAAYLKFMRDRAKIFNAMVKTLSGFIRK